LDAGLSLEPENTEEPEVAYNPYSNSTDGTARCYDPRGRSRFRILGVL